MAVTPVGNPYVESSDNVADFPGASEALAERIDIVGVNPFANAAARDAAIPSPVQGQMCSLNDDNKGYRYDGSAWVLFSGAGDANFTNAATGTYTDTGIDYKYLTLTGSTSVTIDKAGFADVLLIGGGGAGGGGARGGGGGAGGHLVLNDVYLPTGDLTCVVGAGGTSTSASGSQTVGLPSVLVNYFSSGGGHGGGTNGGDGASGGGGRSISGRGGTGISGQGNNGGAGTVAFTSPFAASGGGGAGAVGAIAPNTSTGGAGGTGTASSITGSSVTRCGGGGGGTQGGGTAGAGGTGGGGAGATTTAGTAGTINSGSGGGGAGSSSAGGAGGSGIVIIRVVV